MAMLPWDFGSESDSMVSGDPTALRLSDTHFLLELYQRQGLLDKARLQAKANDVFRRAVHALPHRCGDIGEDVVMKDNT